jgi:predicted molibdopterin-dependent oxidoreductase YjgC
MPTDPLFQPLAGAAPRATVRIHFDGRALNVPAGSSVAAALLQAGVRAFRHSPVGGGPRAPYCMMGACFECLVMIDGESSRQACLVTVREGMQVKPQDGLPSFDAPTQAAAPAEARHEA